jgi:hypothetical protein
LNIEKLITTESLPVKADAPLLSGTKIAKPATTAVFFGMPGFAITDVCAAALVDIAEKLPEVLQLALVGQLSTINAAG